MPTITAATKSTLNETRTQTPSLPSRTHHESGYFTVNDRLFPERSRHPFIFRMDTAPDNERNLNQNDSDGVKVSIPRSRIQPIVRSYTPRTRRSYDPGDSVSIGSYLHRGYEPFVKDQLGVKASMYSSSTSLLTFVLLFPPLSTLFVPFLGWQVRQRITQTKKY